jgi:predicted NAD/FAD-dependent oxidoreductase
MRSETSDYLVIGAGVAGLALAADLTKTKKKVICVDKGRVVGGRCATRTLASGSICDYGTQYFTANSMRLTRWVQTWLDEPETTLRAWNRGYPTWEFGAIKEREPGHARYAPTTGMQAIPERLAQGTDVRVSTTITALTRDGDNWVATGHAHPGETPVSFTTKNLCLTLPAEQLLRIAEPFLPEEMRAKLKAVTYDPAWTVIASIEQDLPFEHTAVEFKNHPVLGWLARDHTKRDFRYPQPILVVHGAGKWSQVHLEDWKDSVQAAVLSSVEHVFGKKLNVLEAHTHRWRYALPTKTTGEPFLADKAQGLYICGDGCGGVRLENAIATGWLLAEAITG